jgi:Fe-S cluster assembly scaffold protein SufB
MSAVAEQTGQWLAEFTRQDKVAPWMQELRNSAFQRFAELGLSDYARRGVAFHQRGAHCARAVRQRYLCPSSHRCARRAGSKSRRTVPREIGFVSRQRFRSVEHGVSAEAVVIQVPRGAVIDKPIRIDYTAADGACVAPRALIVVGADAHCTIVESYSGTGRYFTNAVTEIVAGDRSVVDHYKVQREDTAAFHVATLQAQLGRSTNFSTHSISLGGALVRNDVNVVLARRHARPR